jgi:hypothetical protein
MLTPQDAIRIWRNPPAPQCFDALINKNGARCAIGQLGGEELYYSRYHGAAMFRAAGADAVVIGMLCGLSRADVTDILNWNDADHLPLAAIADLYERKLAAREGAPQ